MTPDLRDSRTSTNPLDRPALLRAALTDGRNRPRRANLTLGLCCLALTSGALRLQALPATAEAAKKHPLVLPTETAAAPAPPKSAAAGGRSPAAWPFAETSPWNTPLGSGAQLEAAAAPCSQTFRDASAQSDINAGEWSHPVYQARNSDPLVRIVLYGEVKISIHVPAAAEPARPHTADTDGHLHIIDPTQHYVDELFHARRAAGGKLLADVYNRNDLRGPGVGKGGVRAYGGSAIGGLIRRGELRDGIHHVLAIALPRRAQRRGPVWPATAEDDFSEKDYRGNVPMGQLLALPRDLDADTLHLGAQGRVLLRALQDYGAYDVDSAADFSLYGEPPVESELGTARDDWAKLRPLLRCVTNSRADAVGGPGTRVVAPAQPLSAD